MRVEHRQHKAMRPAGVLVALGVTLALAGCGTAVRTTGPGAGGVAILSSQQAPATVRPITKLVTIVVENHSLREMRAQMPYLSALSRNYGYADHFHAITHPSLPNYLAMIGGSTHGIRDDQDPSSHPIRTASVFGQAIRAGKSAKVYADGMLGNCALNKGGNRYAVRHNTWTYFVAERSLCRRYDVPLTALPADIKQGRLPNAGMIVPNLCDDAHDCPLSQADAFLRTWVRRLVAGPDWKAGRLVIVVTADEDDRSEGNTVLTTVVRPHQAPHLVTASLNHYSITRLYDDVLGVAYLLGARTAHSMTTAFHIPVARR